jgi:hypothetical protein
MDERSVQLASGQARLNPESTRMSADEEMRSKVHHEGRASSNTGIVTRLGLVLWMSGPAAPPVDGTSCTE